MATAVSLPSYRFLRCAASFYCYRRSSTADDCRVGKCGSRAPSHQARFTPSPLHSDSQTSLVLVLYGGFHRERADVWKDVDWQSHFVPLDTRKSITRSQDRAHASSLGCRGTDKYRHAHGRESSD